VFDRGEPPTEEADGEGRTTTVAMVREKLTAERKTPLSLSQPKINCCAVRRGLDIRGK
jgi:hypothetical protein